MKTLRYAALLLMLAVPTTALGQRALGSTDCCDGGACCHPGCPLCAHGHAR